MAETPPTIQESIQALQPLERFFRAFEGLNTALEGAAVAEQAATDAAGRCQQLLNEIDRLAAARRRMEDEFQERFRTSDQEFQHRREAAEIEQAARLKQIEEHSAAAERDADSKRAGLLKTIQALEATVQGLKDQQTTLTTALAAQRTARERQIAQDEDTYKARIAALVNEETSLQQQVTKLRRELSGLQTQIKHLGEFASQP